MSTLDDVRAALPPGSLDVTGAHLTQYGELVLLLQTQPEGTEALRLVKEHLAPLYRGGVIVVFSNTACRVRTREHNTPLTPGGGAGSGIPEIAGRFEGASRCGDLVVRKFRGEDGGGAPDAFDVRAVLGGYQRSVKIPAKDFDDQRRVEAVTKIANQVRIDVSPFKCFVDCDHGFMQAFDTQGGAGRACLDLNRVLCERFDGRRANAETYEAVLATMREFVRRTQGAEE